MAASSIRIVARLTAKPDCADKVLSILRAVVEPTRQEAGCISYQLLQNRADSTDFTFVEEWVSDGAIDNHLAATHIQEALVRLAGLLSAAPDIRRHTLLK